MIKIEHISVLYQTKQVFEDFSLEIEEGSTVCITGESGVGKSTLLKVMMGLVLPAQGRICGLEGKKTSVIFQEDRLCEQLSAIKNVMMVLEGKHKREIAGNHLLELLKAEDLEQQTIRLSGGMKRRVSIARAFAYPSDIILMDEPFTGLDDANKQKTIEYMLKYKKERTLIFVTHDINDANALMANQIVRLTRSK